MLKISQGEIYLMSVVLPFKALRPHKQFVKAVASYPYDVVSMEEAREIVRINPLNFLRIEKSEIDLPDPHVADDERVYEIAKENFERLTREGILYQDEAPCFYIYRQKAGSHEQYGIVARASLAEYESGRIKKHELTRPDKEADRIKHVLAVNAHTGPVFLTYRAQHSIDRLVNSVVTGDPEYDFVADDGVTHTVWIVNGVEEIAAISEAFKRVETLYIADGHHRAAAAAAVRKMKLKENPLARGDEAYNYVMVVIFPHDQLKIMSYNRAVRDLNGLNEDEFLRMVCQRFDISESFEKNLPERIHEIGMYFRGVWYTLTAKEEISDGSDPAEVLDVSVLQESLLQPVLGIQDPRTDSRIEFVGGNRGTGELEKMVNSGKFAVAFSLYPTGMEQLIAVSDEGRVMPPKSTWFEPKLRSGIFIHPLS
jgi:uncharacterized protein (DUF1015 family)